MTGLKLDWENVGARLTLRKVLALSGNTLREKRAQKE